jgi:hypothetical protein
VLWLYFLCASDVHAHMLLLNLFLKFMISCYTFSCCSKFFSFSSLFISFISDDFHICYPYDQTFIIVISIIRKERNKFSYPSTQDLYILFIYIVWKSFVRSTWLADYLSKWNKKSRVCCKLSQVHAFDPNLALFFDWLLSMMCYTSWNEIERCARYIE